MRIKFYRPTADNFHMKKQFAINDPVHGRIILSEIEKLVIDHKIFQRLRRIKALGLLEKVFPSARHSRFEHSIGACHIAGEILTALFRNHQEVSDLSRWQSDSLYRPWSTITDFLDERRVQQIKLAALLHDIGHGPFSHASEEIMPKRETLLSANEGLPKYIESVR